MVLKVHKKIYIFIALFIPVYIKKKCCVNYYMVNGICSSKYTLL